MECDQSSSSVVTLYKYAPIFEDETTYLLGNSTYLENYCWPGFSPFYSYFYQYPTNFQYSLVKVFTALKNLLNAFQVPGPVMSEAPSSETTESEERDIDGFDFMNVSYWLVDMFSKGLEYNEKEMNGEIQRRSTEELNQMTTKRIMKN